MQRLLTLVGLVALLVSPVVPAAEAGSSSAVSLALSPRTLTYGAAQKAAGTVMADSPCDAGRTVDLQQKVAGSGLWSAIDTTTSDANGHFSFSSRTPSQNAAYRAVAEAGVVGAAECDRLASSVVKGVVRAAVTFGIRHRTRQAGECTASKTTVRPSKAGQHVAIQERDPSGWRAVETLTLNDSSVAKTTLCETWADLGTHRLRARWNAQDKQNAPGASDAVSTTVKKAPWMVHVDDLAAGRSVGVSIRAGGHVLYEREATSAFAPASNEKLLLSMALLDHFGIARRIETDAAAGSVRHGVVRGDLWILGHGDPSTGPAELDGLARAVAAAGVHKVTGRVMGSTTYFARDWFAPGWKKDFPKDEVGLPSALTYQENHIGGRNVSDPERYAAAELMARLKTHGVKVRNPHASFGSPPGGLSTVASVRSPRLAGLLRHMDRESDNFYAEDLGKGLAAATVGPPGTIAHAAAIIAAWARSHGANVALSDSSGLSYDDRATAHGVAGLLQVAAAESWGTTLRRVLPRPGQGTLEGRHLAGVKVRAKTGTLTHISALSGYVKLSEADGTWAQFSILDRGMTYTRSKDLEDAIVRTFASSAH